MSEYVNISLFNNGRLLPLSSGSRSSWLFRFYRHFGNYDDKTFLSLTNLFEVVNTIHEERLERRRAKEISEKRIELVLAANNTIDEKIDKIESYSDFITEWEEIDQELLDALNFTNFLIQIYHEAEDTQYCEDEQQMIDPSEYICITIS